MTDYNDGKWHGWNGGECPVHPKSIVQIQKANETRKDVENESTLCHNEGEYWDWSNDGNEGDIIAFRVIKPYREARVLWMKPHSMIDGCLVECKPGHPQAILFREVLPD